MLFCTMQLFRIFWSVYAVLAFTIAADIDSILGPHVLLLCFWQLEYVISLLWFANLQTLTKQSRHRAGGYAVNLDIVSVIKRMIVSNWTWVKPWHPPRIPKPSQIATQLCLSGKVHNFIPILVQPFPYRYLITWLYAAPCLLTLSMAATFSTLSYNKD